MPAHLNISLYFPLCPDLHLYNFIHNRRPDNAKKEQTHQPALFKYYQQLILFNTHPPVIADGSLAFYFFGSTAAGLSPQCI